MESAGTTAEKFLSYGMCGRFTHTVDRVEFILARFRAEMAPGFEGYKAAYNVAPGQMVPAVAARDDRRWLMNMLWGIVPPWGEVKEGHLGQQINVRDDTIIKNSFFRGRLLHNRCIFIADGFYEWQIPAEYRNLPRGTRLPKGVAKTPYWIRVKGQELFPLAGLWRTVEIGGKQVVTAAIITTAPNPFMEDIHNRMPLILTDEQLDRWLDPGFEDYAGLQRLLVPFEGSMEAQAVSIAVNSGRIDDARCIEPI